MLDATTYKQADESGDGAPKNVSWRDKNNGGNFDKIGALARWVEKGAAPDRIVASHIRAERVVRTRPLCPYPLVAKWNGTGSTNAAGNLTCAAE